METGSVNVLTPQQMQMLEMISHVKTEEELADIRQLIADYFSQKLERQMDQLWDEGVVNDGVIDQWKHTHMRTPYKQ